MTFKSLGLSDALLKAISKKGYETPSAIQQKAIPLILESKDVLASAQTGSGKTAGFALPILQILNSEPAFRKRPVRALILTPTRELAAQVQDEFKEYSEYTDLRSTVIFGGVGANPQIRALRNGVDILVATPGRLLDLENQNALSLSKVEILVLDEADRMLDMGFLRDIKKILALLPSKRQNLLFSATFSKEIKKLANEFLHHPVLVEATPENTTVEKIDQTVYRVDKAQKTELIIKLISEGNWKQVLVFTRTKHGANRLSEKLEKAKITSAAIHGNKSQGARTRALSGFKEGRIRVLVATDIAARGLDIPLLPHVINYELPNVSEDYVHRIGRTGRAGASGEALSLVSLDEVGYLKDIEKLIGERLQPKTLPDFQPTETMADVKAAEEEKKQQRANRHSRGRNAQSKKSAQGKKQNSGRNRGRR
ncbi:DEAD/DEAH box helicase [Aequorivita flava]|uniref:DEAD-box ATP-dependent RNA helicase RhpA n=1 Tax=Aequorivita flava TaxID=3114371 RepID=A0AB35YVA5_9FLAO